MKARRIREFHEKPHTLIQHAARRPNGVAKWVALTGMTVFGACTPPDLSGGHRLGTESAGGQMLSTEPEVLLEPKRTMQTPQSSLDNAPSPGPRGEPTARSVDLWARMRRQFSIPRFLGTRTQRHLDWFQRNEDYLDQVTERARDYLPYIVREAERRGLPVELALLPVVESAFQPFAYSSSSQASGLWQFIPSTARQYGLRINWWYDGRRDLVAATSAAFDYLEKLNRDFEGDWLLTAAAYNWGEGNLRRALARNRQDRNPLDFWSLPVPSETRAYVPRWLAICELIARPDRYGVTLKPLSDEVDFRVVRLEHQMDLARAAELAEISLDRLRRLNPGYRRSATEPDEPHYLLIPTANEATFTRGVTRLSPRPNVAWRRHAVVAGDTLGEIALRYGASVAVLKQINQLSSSLIRVGEELAVPVSVSYVGSYARDSETRRELHVSGARETPSRFHKVEKGENLWSIARRHGVSLTQLVAWNDLDPNAWLRPGQHLALRLETRPEDPVASVPDILTGKDDGDYVVRRGDNLWLIARRHSVSIKQLALWNQLALDGILYPGQTLRTTPPNVGPTFTNSL